MLGQNDRHFTAWEMAEVDFRQTELDIVCCDRDIATRDHGEAAAEYPTVDLGNHRLRHFAQDLVAPLARLLPHLIAHALRLRIHLDKILLQILPGAKALPCSGDDDHAGLL